MKCFMAVDGNWLLHRAYSVLGKYVQTPTVRIPQLLLDWFCSYAIRLGADAGALCFDGPENYRKALFKGYKASRDGDGSSEHRDGVYECLDPTKALFEAAGICVVQLLTHEADDMLASASKYFGKDRGIKTYLVAKDKDTYQNIRENVIVYTPEMSKTPEQFWDLTRLKKERGFTPAQMLDFQILLGDAIDEVPGIPGFGAATAKKVLLKHGSLRAFFETPEGAEVLSNHGKQLMLNRRLVGMSKDAWPEDAKVEFIHLTKKVPSPYRDKHYQSLIGLQRKRVSLF